MQSCTLHTFETSYGKSTAKHFPSTKKTILKPNILIVRSQNPISVSSLSVLLYRPPSSPSNPVQALVKWVVDLGCKQNFFPEAPRGEHYLYASACFAIVFRLLWLWRNKARYEEKPTMLQHTGNLQSGDSSPYRRSMADIARYHLYSVHSSPTTYYIYSCSSHRTLRILLKTPDRKSVV